MSKTWMFVIVSLLLVGVNIVIYNLESYVLIVLIKLLLPSLDLELTLYNCLTLSAIMWILKDGRTYGSKTMESIR